MEWCMFGSAEWFEQTPRTALVRMLKVVAYVPACFVWAFGSVLIGAITFLPILCYNYIRYGRTMP